MDERIMTAAEESTEAAALTDLSGKVEEKMEENELYVKFRKPYVFEDKTYDGVDLSGLEDLSGDDMIAVQRKMERAGHFSTLPELSVEYACLICSRATNLPEEFFRGLPLKDSTRLKNKVTSFLYGGESE